jgi:hypothetical protein
MEERGGMLTAGRKAELVAVLWKRPKGKRTRELSSGRHYFESQADLAQQSLEH